MPTDEGRFDALDALPVSHVQTHQHPPRAGRKRAEKGGKPPQPRLQCPGLLLLLRTPWYR
jgi:hypothetical protein